MMSIAYAEQKLEWLILASNLAAGSGKGSPISTNENKKSINRLKLLFINNNMRLKSNPGPWMELEYRQNQIGAATPTEYYFIVTSSKVCR